MTSWPNASIDCVGSRVWADSGSDQERPIARPIALQTGARRSPVMGASSKPRGANARPLRVPMEWNRSLAHRASLPLPEMPAGSRHAGIATLAQRVVLAIYGGEEP